MGLLDQVIGGVVGQVLGRGQQGALSPIVKALLMLLLAKGASGGFGDIFGRGHAEAEGGSPPPPPRQDGGDLGGFGNAPRGGPAPDDGDFSDLAGMLDGPGERAPGAGPYAHLDREPSEESGSAGGLDGLVESFRRSGLGDVIESWIGPGGNHAIAPSRLADALGPDTLDSLSRATGLSRDDLLAQLAQALPGVVDRLTPQGRLPSESERRGW